MRERYRVGTDYLKEATTLLQRVRSVHPTIGLYEAADLNWWWRQPRSTDHLRQLFWFDDCGRPEAAVIFTDWGNRVALDPIVLPGAKPDWVAQVLERGLAHASESGFGVVDIMVDLADDVLRDVLVSHGFTTEEGEHGEVESWLAADARPEITPLNDDYRLFSRLDMMPLAHHMIHRNGPEIETRLRQTSLYRPDLDLVILHGRENIAAYGLFWLHPETSTGLVEPMRTADDHQRRGLARHLLTTGIDHLIDAGAERIKIVFELDNPASSSLYLSIGFEPVKQTVIMTGRTSAQTCSQTE